MAQEGIATLPMQGAPAPQQAVSSQDALDASKQALAQTLPGGLEEYERVMDQLVAEIDLPPEQVDQLLQVIDMLLNNEARYPELRQQLIESGVADEEDLPPEFDRGYLTTLLNVLLEKQNRTGPTAMPAPQEFNGGGLAAAAESLRRKGRGQDTMLAHINPEEARMLKRMGGSGTINPETGLPEFGFLSKAFKAVTKPIKKIASSTVGRVVLTVALGAVLGPAGLGLSSALAGGLAAAGTTLAAGGSIKDALVSGAIGGMSIGLAPSVGSVMPGAAGSFLNTALSAGAVGTGVGLLSGQNLKQALKTGAMAGVTAGGIGALGSQMTPQEPSAMGTDLSRTGSIDAAGNFVPADTAANVATPGAVTAVNPTGTGGSTVLTPNAVTATAPGGIGISPGPAPVITPAATPTAAGQTLGANYNFTPNYSLNAPVASTGATPGISGISSAPAGEMTLGRIGNNIMQGNFGQAVSDAGTWMGQNKLMTAGLALGATGALGGFKPNEEQPAGIVSSKTGQDFINANPNRYIVGGLPGVSYTPEGNIGNPSTLTGATMPTSYNTAVATPAYGTNVSAFPSYPGYGNYAPAAYNFMPRMLAQGGIATIDSLQFADPNAPMMAQGYRNGGTPQYPRRTGQIDGPGTETSDSIPAMLSDGEFVMTAKAVRGMGNGSRRAGAKKLYRMMHAMEKKAGGSI